MNTNGYGNRDFLIIAATNQDYVFNGPLYEYRPTREGAPVITTSCVNCDATFIVWLDDSYLDSLQAGRSLVSRHVCEECGTVNYVEHRTIGGETFGEDDPRAQTLEPFTPPSKP